MKHSAAMNVKVGDLLALNHLKDGVLYEVVNMAFPLFKVRESFLTTKAIAIHYNQFQRPTKAQMNAYQKRKEKYYAGNSETSTNRTSGTGEQSDNQYR